MATALLTGLGHRYGGAAAPALLDVDLALGPGLTVVTGPSGGGKSTLLRVLNGLVPHFSGGTVTGRARVAGLDVATTPTRRLARHVGLVVQDCEALLLGGTVEREVAFGLENLGVAPSRMPALVEAALDRVGAGGLRSRTVASLSGGERQRVAVAAAIVTAPEVLVLDEPTSQLDLEATAAVADLCERLAGQGTAVVVAEHRLERLLRPASTLVLVEAGRVTGTGPPADLAGRLAAPPQVVALGLRAGWHPLPLDGPTAASRLGDRLRRLPATPAAGPRDLAWELRDAVAGAGRTAVVEVAGLCGGAGEVVCLVGPNGGGKTTLLRTLAGLVRPLAGSATHAPGRVAYLPQDPAAALCRETVRDEVLLTLRRTGDAGSPDAVLDTLGLRPVADRHPRDLSAGQRQRAAVAAMLCGRPRLALLDEPTRGMDALARRALVTLVRTLAGEGSAVVLATHDTELAAEVADRVVEVAGGTVRDLGAPRTALTGTSPYATQLGALVDSGPVTVDDAVALL